MNLQERINRLGNVVWYTHDDDQYDLSRYRGSWWLINRRTQLEKEFRYTCIFARRVRDAVNDLEEYFKNPIKRWEEEKSGVNHKDS